MGVTATYSLPYPEGADQPQVHLDLKALADSTDAAVAAQIAGAPGRELLRLDSTGTTTATTVTPVNIAGVDGGTFTLSASRKIRLELHAQTITGASGGENARITIGPIGRRSQVQINSAGASGETSTTVMSSGTLAAGTHTVTATLLRVAGGTSVSASSVQLVVLDCGPA